MAFQRGEVVLIPFPFTDLSASKTSRLRAERLEAGGVAQAFVCASESGRD